MKIIGVKLQKGYKKIRETQKIYYYNCPIENINIGEYVIVDISKWNDTYFTIARVEEIHEDTKELRFQIQPTGFIFCKVPVKDVKKRVRAIQDNRQKLFSKYKYYNYKRQKKIEKEMKKSDSI